MADPLSISASIVALIQAVRVGSKALAKVKSCYKALPEVGRLATEMASLGQLLEKVHEMVDDQPEPMARYSGDLLSAPLELASARIASVNTILLSPAFGLSKLNDASRAHLTILRYSKRLAALEQILQASKQDLGVRLSLVSA